MAKAKTIKPSPELGKALKALTSADYGPPTTLGEAITAEVRRRGRPSTGRTPDAERQRQSRALRRLEGHKPVNVILSPEAAEHLGIIMLAEGLTEKEAIERALATHVEKHHG